MLTELSQRAGTTETTRSTKAAATPAMTNSEELQTLLDAFRRTQSVRETASTDVNEFARRVEEERTRFRTLTRRFERSSEPRLRRQLQASLQHLCNLRFALRNATATVQRADRRIADLQARLANLYVAVGDKAA